MRKLFIVLFNLIACTAIYGQINYIRTIFSGAYVPVSASATKLVAGNGNGQFYNGGPNSDEGTAYISLPFNFNYAGITYTTSHYLGICANGYVYPSKNNSNASKVGTNGNNFATTASPVGSTPIIAPYWGDLIANTTVNGITGSVKYEVTGTPGSQVLTVEWSNYPSFTLTTPSTTPRALNFEVKLYEGTNIIEFWYGPTFSGTSGCFSTSESASIGIKNSLGGANNFIDAITGSSIITTSEMNSLQFPRYNYRFTPGMPTAITTGTYNVGVGQIYPNLSEAVADLNHRGISGPVTLNLTDAVYDTSVANGSNIFPIVLTPIAGVSSTNTITIQPASGTAIIKYRGNPASGGFTNQANAPIISTSNEPILGLIGSDWVTIKNLNLAQFTGGIGYVSAVKRGLLVGNATSNDGANNNTIQNINITLDRANTSTIGLQQQSVGSLTSSGGANSSNKYYDITVADSYSGVYFTGDPTFPDLNCELGKLTIGSTTANDIGNGSEAAWGIRASYQSGIKIFNSEVRNVTANSTANVDGINLENFVGTNEIFNNKIHDISSASPSYTSPIVGLRLSHSPAGTNSVRVYNNFVYGLSSAYNSTASTINQIKGIYVAGAGGSTSQVYNIDFNSINIDGSSSPNISSSCIEITNVAGPVINVRNNIFANVTGAQTTAKHVAVVVPSNTLVGNTGSTWNYNDYYIANNTNGFLGTGSTLDRAILSDWQTAYAQDANSKNISPGFNSNTDLHLSSGNLNDGGDATGITWVTTDMDGDLRCPAGGCPGAGTKPDIGADEFSLPTGGTILPVQLVSFNCHREGAVNILKWTTAAEQNSKGFYIERSADGIHFATIGFVYTQANNGNTGLLSYVFVDSNVSGNKQYYRLRQIDIDGKADLSNIILINGTKPSLLKLAGLFPNPIHSGKLTVSIDAPTVTKLMIMITDLKGRVVQTNSMTLDAGSNSIYLDTDNLKPALYFLKAMNVSNFQTVVKGFVKE